MFGTDAEPSASMLETRRLGEILLARGLIREDELSRALSFQSQYGGLLGAILVRTGALAEDALLAALSDQLGLPVLGAAQLPADPARYGAAIQQSGLPADWWLEQEALCFEEGEGLCIAARHPLDPGLRETVSMALRGRTVAWALIRNQDLDRTMDLVRQHGLDSRAGEGDDISHLRELAEEAPVVEFVNNMLAQAVNEAASDIHVEPGERQMAVRLRLDGVLQTRATLPRQRFDAIASRIKLISGMDIAERRLPQDGRLGIRLSGQELDIRVSAVPGMWGESIVMRLLPKERRAFRLDRLGMQGRAAEGYRAVIREPHGILLVTGPTGSGKSTTLYATLEEIHDGSAKIVTVEDPVEYNIPGVTQIQVHADIDYTFARALRAILRQDPDVIMIGEIRDLETAQIAIQSALTGHLVFSTLHTNDSVGAFTRLMDMGLEPFLVADSVRGVLAQRLVRRVCPACAHPADPPAWALGELEALRRRLPDFPDTPPRWRRAVGCPSCHQTGYRGRLALYEFAPVTPWMREAVMQRRPAADMKAMLDREGFRDLRADGLVKAWAGETTLDEVLRTTGLAAGGLEGDDAA